MEYLEEEPIEFILTGIGVHLWFLPALVIALFIIAIFIRAGLQRYLLFFAAALFAFGLLAGSYSATPMGIHIPFNTRNGPFFSALFSALGWWLSGRERQPGVKSAVILVISGLILQIAEAVFLWKHFGVKMNTHDYLLGTVPFGIGAFLLGLSLPPFRGLSLLQPLGKYTLGVYVSHVLVIFLVSHFFDLMGGSIAGEIAFPFSVYIFSVLLTAILFRYRLTSLLVR